MIVVGGECLVDLLVWPDGQVAAVPGGGPFNVARGLARLGAEAAFVGAISSDGFGRRLRASLEEDGVDLRWAQETALPTTLAVAELHPEGAEYRFYVDGTSAPSLADASGVPVCDALHVGSLGLVLEPMATALEALAERARGRALVMADVNWRPAAIADAAAHGRRLRRVLGLADVVKASTEDLALMGAAAGDLLAGDTRCVLVTDGAERVRALWRGGEVDAEVPPARVADTVGAGDAFCAGFLAAWLQAGGGAGGLEDPARLQPALAFGARVAALTCERRGADPPRAHELA